MENFKTGLMLIIFFAVFILNQSNVQNYLKEFFGFNKNINKTESGADFFSAKIGGNLPSEALPKSLENFKDKTPKEKMAEPEKEKTVNPAINVLLLDEIKITAKSAIIADENVNVLYQKNAAERLPIASLTKLMTASVIFEKGNLSDEITISKSAIKSEGDTRWLTIGKKATIDNLIKTMLIESSNDAAEALKEYFESRNLSLIALMNKKAEELDLKDTKFTNPSGLDPVRNKTLPSSTEPQTDWIFNETDNKSQFSTASDLAKLAEFILKNQPEILAITKNKELKIKLPDNSEQILRNTDILLDKFPEIVGGKTGYTYNAEECLVLIANIKGKNFIFVILGSKDRFGEMEKLINWVKDKI